MRLRARSVLLAVVAVSVVGIPAMADHTDPDSVVLDLAPGDATVLTKTVTTPEVPPQPDIVFLADTTGSMGPQIANVRNNATSVMNQVVAAQPTANFAAAEYRDRGDVFTFRVNEGLTASVPDVQTAINGWAAGGGGDFPEAQLFGLNELATGAVTYRPDGTRIIVWFGDAPGHDPSLGVDEGTAIANLQGAGVRVIAVDVGALNTSGQATRISSQTGGSYLVSPSSDQVANTILAGLTSLPVEVTPDHSCDPGLGLSFSPTSQTVTSGDDAIFDETVHVLPNAPQGTTLSCTVRFLLDGVDAGEHFVQTITVNVRDVTPPEVNVDDQTVEATGPDGAAVDLGATATDNVDGPLTPTCTPASGSTFPLGATGVECSATDSAGLTGSDTATITVVDTTGPEATCTDGPNPDGEIPGPESGFFTLSSSDIVDLDEGDIYVRDTGSGHVFGPFEAPVNIKYTQASGSEPSQRPGSGQVDWRLRGSGDAEVWSVDTSGNVGPSVFCLVPPHE